MADQPDVTRAFIFQACRRSQSGVSPGNRWYTLTVPTTRPRYQVTETPAIARALDIAAKRWPGVPRSKLLVRLVEAAGDILEKDEDAKKLVHRATVLASAGRYPEAFGPDYLAELRLDWPA